MPRLLKQPIILGALATAACLCACRPLTQTAQAGSVRAEPYVWRNVAIGGGGFVTGVIFHPHQKDLIYARTDVGGAYRWDAASRCWLPLTDWLGAADANLTGIESIAVDPADPNHVYLAAGTYSSGNAAILRSADQGRTFQRTDVPFKMGANEMGRFNGERLAVDPNQGNILFFGSRRDGLWQSTDRGASWKKVDSFPIIPSDPAPDPPPNPPGAARSRFSFLQQPVGIVCVLFDPSSGRPGHRTPTLYAAASTAETNLFCSTNAGATWQPVAHQPLGLRPNHLVLAPDRILYLTYGKEAGPNTMTDGAVWKFNLQTGAWTDITPLKPGSTDQPFGYGAVAVDAQHPATIMVTTFARWRPRDEIFRSTDGGGTWTPLLEAARWDFSGAPYTETRTPHWMGDIEINPFNPDHVLFTTGYGIWACVNATASRSGQPTRWAFLNDGLEETVPLALISPPEGAPLLSGLGDIDGFRHDDLTVSPHGPFAGPRFSNTEDLALAGKNPSTILRTGTSRSDSVRAAISRDGGKTWSSLGSEPPNSGGGGTIAVSANAETIVWTPRRGRPHFSTDQGTNWTVCAGLSAGQRVVADPVNASRFYTCDAQAGRVLISTNAAASFTATEASFPPDGGARPGFGDTGAALFTTPGLEGDLWLACRNRGLYHSTNAGVSFAKLEQVSAADALGFGKAAPGRTHPAVYLFGKVVASRALFRSDDAGETWVRINDDLHQFGFINRLTGDPRVYGRVYLATGGRGIIYGDPAAMETKL